MLEESQKADAQQALDELFSENLLPFKLAARAVEAIGLQEYIIRFYDSRLNSVIVSWYEGLSFKDICRTAVLEKVEAFSGPLRYTTVAPVKHQRTDLWETAQTDS
jgi:hypothetical protein